jgi:dTDP-4-amino-4,6-dideoxygalactose transaminase
MPVYLFGLPAEMEKISEIARAHRLPVIEDAAQAIGARYQDQYVGNIGSCGCFSFFPSKNLGGAGDGGMITTNDPELAERISVLRDHGSRKKYHYDLVGMNSRLDTLQAAILLVKFKHLEPLSKARRRNADRYRQLFRQASLDKSITLPIEPAGLHHVYNQFVIRTPERDQLREHLRNCGIPTEIYYPSPLHLQPAFADLGCGPGAFSAVGGSQPGRTGVARVFTNDRRTAEDCGGQDGAVLCGKRLENEPDLQGRIHRDPANPQAPQARREGRQHGRTTGCT